MDVSELLQYVVLLLLLYKLWDYVYRMPHVSGLSGKWVLITGCDSGFGHEAAKRLDSLGMHVFAGCLTDTGCRGLKANCSPRLHTLRIDVTDEGSVTQAYQQVKQALPHGTGLWGLINNAGIYSKIAPLEWMDLQDYQQVLDVNLLGLIHTTTTFLPLLKQTGGRIVNTSSIGGRLADGLATPYCVSKYGVEAFSDTLRRQVSPYGVRVSVIEPGFYATSFADHDLNTRSLDRAWRECPPDIRAQYGKEYLPEVKAHRLKMLEQMCSKKTHHVVDAYTHAITATYPRARYMVGLFTRWVLWPVTWLPDAITDLLFSHNYPTPHCCRT